ncbi:hypothetical protein J2S40_004502 [Nocardioides luteus]|uniref:Uncharacterized protein n=1 Tax=Nocardioides luteus TaxID=1844 RepID=A0ABQ5SS67_9ACTN|nr:hypothetical protein [Nocardioides luteus]MDR7313444.1 hypothetical protein [Nocardioides luteus]GGR60929.1 hypothetical protein GCM10010197_30090 [Nocardioides luteus]GLJ66510.1 hypothetical protein GCM10017579_05460 [Nocardioides luteus]
MNASSQSNTTTTTPEVAPARPEAGDNTPSTSAPKACPACGSAEAWHGVITEPGEGDRHACDACGTVRTVRILESEPVEAVHLHLSPRPVAESVEGAWPSVPCPSWCTNDHAEDVDWTVTDPGDVFEHLGAELARLPLAGETRVSVRASHAFTRAGAEHGRTVAVECGRDLTIEEARHFAEAVLQAVAMVEPAAGGAGMSHDEPVQVEEAGEVDLSFGAILPPELDSKVSGEDQDRDNDFIESVLERHRAAAETLTEREWAALGRRMFRAQLDDTGVPITTSEHLADLSGISVRRLWLGEES